MVRSSSAAWSWPNVAFGITPRNPATKRNTASPQTAEAPLYVPPPSENVLSAPRQRNECIAVCMPLCSPQCIQNQPQPSPYTLASIPAQPQLVSFPSEHPSAVPSQPLPFVLEPGQVVPAPLPVPPRQFTPTVPLQPQCIPPMTATESAWPRGFMVCVLVIGAYQCCRRR
ncbi:unnamed protein product [Toxocara canis]|uniref:Extensin-like n=1 Tax=Toxocara canis TaxID=6265 RepID=A0A183V3T2_TOXCA|nr:unnamed protein product [Toxocara canis]